MEIGPDDIILVTGATGFIGSAVVRRLLARGLRVRALVRPGSRVDELLRQKVELAPGDLRDADSLREALRSVRWLFHLAAEYKLWSRDPAGTIATNVDGTRRLFEAAADAGVERIVYTSSVAALSVNPDGSPADESRPLDPDEAIGAYKRSKALAERGVVEMIAKGLPATIVNPSAPVGPGDARPTPTGRIIIEAARGRMPAFVDTGLNMAHVDDVAEGHLLAMQRGRIGERYILGGQNAFLSEILACVAHEVGRAPPRISIPRAMVYPIAYLSQVASLVTGREPFVTVDGLRMSEKQMFFTSRKAERELGYSARPYEQGVTDALSWYREAGVLPARQGGSSFARS